jgi:Tat protein translocase TatB subunit
MFGLSWGQILIIVLVAAFVLGPERIPTAVNVTLGTIRKARGLAAGTQATLLRDLGPEIEELRRQVADLQSLKELADLQSLAELRPQQWSGKSLLATPPPHPGTDPRHITPVPPAQGAAAAQPPPACSPEPLSNGDRLQPGRPVRDHADDHGAVPKPSK